MNKKSWIVISFFVVSVIIAIFAYQFLSQPKLTFSGPERIKDNPQSLPEGVPDPSDASILDKLDALKKINPKLAIAKFRASGANAPIEFYAQLLDQYNKPIIGANINIEVGQAALGGGWQSIIAKTRTDQNGRFVLRDVRGEKHLITSIEKAGYIFNHSTKKLFWTWPRTEDMEIETTNPSSPWIYRGWKAEEVVDIKKIVVLGKMIPDGRSYTASITPESTSQIIWKEGNDGDINISINRDVIPDEIRWFASDFRSWSLTIEIKNGGVIEIPYGQNDGYHFLAPENGYVSTIKAESKKEDRDWTREFKRHYYIKLQEGQIYGRVIISSRPLSRKDYSSAGLRLELNFNGSRNLFSINQ